MDWIGELKQKNVTFDIVAEKFACGIMEEQYSYYKLMEYSELFDKYRSTDKKGQFVKLDFGQLYYLAIIDSKLAKIIMCMCLDVERILKTSFISDVTKYYSTHKFWEEYYTRDKEYLEQAYTAENIDVIKDEYGKVELAQLPFEQWIEVVQFGTLERMMEYFYENHKEKVEHSIYLDCERQLYSVRKLRNIVAHNNSLLAKLTVQTDCKNLEMSAFLGRKGIKHKTLTTNMSKAIISDMCNLLWVYFNIVTEYKMTYEAMSKFDVEVCGKYVVYFENNPLLNTVYKFLKEVTNIIVAEVETGDRNM